MSDRTYYTVVPIPHDAEGHSPRTVQAYTRREAAGQYANHHNWDLDGLQGLAVHEWHEYDFEVNTSKQFSLRERR